MLTNDELLAGSSSLVAKLVERAAWKLPAPTRRRTLRWRRQREFDSYLRAMMGPQFRAVSPEPAAPPELVAQTSAMSETDVVDAADPDGYFAGGYLGTLLFLKLLAKSGFNPRTAGAILDFGCGAGKMIRLLRALGEVRLVGTDVNRAQIEWAEQNVPGVEFMVNRLEPPLELPDASFDLVYAASVFTHIPFELQDAWLAELRRVLRPGGYFLCTVAGDAHARRQLTPEQRDELNRTGRYALAATDVGVSYSTKITASLDVFQTRAAVLEIWRRHFTVLDYVADPLGQDNLVLQRPL